MTSGNLSEVEAPNPLDVSPAMSGVVVRRNSAGLGRDGIAETAFTGVSIVPGEKTDLGSLGSVPSCSSVEELGPIQATRDKRPLIFEKEGAKENWWRIALQVAFPFLMAGLGMVGAGLTLDRVQHWRVFVELEDIYVVVPALLGLKGNLEMTLASRLSTQANLGHMDKWRGIWTLGVANLALVECQALVVSLLAAIAAVAVGSVEKGTFDINESCVLTAACIFTGALASAGLGLVMIIVIVISRKVGINPDNVATPIAASLGDLTCLILLSLSASFLWDANAAHPWIAPTVIGAFLLTTPIWVFIAFKNPQTKVVLRYGWFPVIGAMIISSSGGYIMDKAIEAYTGIAVFQPVMNGVGGNLVGIQASRLSTYLHSRVPYGQLPASSHGTPCISPLTLLIDPGAESVTARVLLGFVIPGHTLFVFVLALFKAGHTSITFYFMLAYLLAAFTQVFILLYCGHILVHFLWKRSIDPDNSAIPFLTALGDLLGTGFLTLAFYVLSRAGIATDPLARMPQPTTIIPDPFATTLFSDPTGSGIGGYY